MKMLPEDKAWLIRQVEALEARRLNTLKADTLTAFIRKHGDPRTWKERDAEAAWWSHFAQVKTWIHENGRRPLKRSRRKREIELAEWLTAQRTRFQRDARSLNSRQKKELEILPGWFWNWYDFEFDHFLRIINALVRKLKRLTRHKDDAPLHRWRVRMVRWRAEGRLKPAWIKQLEAVPYWRWEK